MARRIVCCPGEKGWVYLYVDTANLSVENITDAVSAICENARESCCLDELAPYGFGEKSLTDAQDALFSFDFYKVNSFELFKTKDELRLKTGSDKILRSCMLNYYRREYDGTQQHTFFSEPSVGNTYVRTGFGPEHELTLENREIIKKNQSEGERELETLDKGKSLAEREAEAELAEAEAEQQAALLAEIEKEEKEARRKKRKRRLERSFEEEKYRELRECDDVQSEEYKQIRFYEEEMRRNNRALTREYNDGNYSSLPGALSHEEFSSAYEDDSRTTLGLSVDNSDLYRLASRMNEFGVPYTVTGETLDNGRQISHVIYSTDYADRGATAKDFFALERSLQRENYISDNTYYNAYQLNALEYAAERGVDTKFVESGDYNGNQMFKILEAGTKEYDMSVLANPSYSPAHMDVLLYYMDNRWDSSSIRDASLSTATVAESITREEIKHNVPQAQSYFETHDYESFLAYGSARYDSSLSSSYEDSQRQQYLKQIEQDGNKDATASFMDKLREASPVSRPLHDSYSHSPSVNKGDSAARVESLESDMYLGRDLHANHFADTQSHFDAPSFQYVDPQSNSVKTIAASQVTPELLSRCESYWKDVAAGKVQAPSDLRVSTGGSAGSSKSAGSEQILGRDVSASYFFTSDAIGSGKTDALLKYVDPATNQVKTIPSSKVTPELVARCENFWKDVDSGKVQLSAELKKTLQNAPKGASASVEGSNAGTRLIGRELDSGYFLSSRSRSAVKPDSQVKYIDPDTGKAKTIAASKVTPELISRCDNYWKSVAAGKIKPPDNVAGKTPAANARGASDSVGGQKKPYTFSSGYTPSGYIRSDGSFAPQKFGTTPGRASRGSVSAGKKPVGTPPSNKSLKKNSFILDDLKVRDSYARRLGLNVRYYGGKMVGTVAGSLRGSLYSVGYKMIQMDETGAAHGGQTSARYVGGAVYTVQLVRDIPAQLARRKYRKLTKDAVGDVPPLMKKDSKGNTVHLLSDGVRKEINELPKKQKEELRKLFGDRAAAFRPSDIKREYGLLQTAKANLIEDNRKLKNEIKFLRSKGKLTRAEEIALKKKLKLKKANEKLIQKNVRKMKELDKLKALQKKHKEALKKLQGDYKLLAKKEMRWKRLPGEIVRVALSPLYKARDDLTMEGLSTASGQAMRISRNPIVRAATRRIKKKLKQRKVDKKQTAKPSATKKTGTSNGQLRKKSKKTIRRKKKPTIKRTKGKTFRRTAKGAAKKTTKKSLFKVGKSVVGKSAKGKIASQLSKLAGKLLGKLAGALGASAGWVVVILIVFLLIVFIFSAMSSFMFIGDEDSDDDKIDLTHYVEFINDCQADFQSEIDDIVSGKTDAGKPYDNVFYDYNGNSDNNTLEIICMAYVKFSGQLDNDNSDVEAYIEQLYKDSNYVDYAVSEKYFCDNGCEEREYHCYDELDEYVTETRKSLHASSDHSGEEWVGEDSDAQHGCVKSELYSCEVIGHGTYNAGGCAKHNDGRVMTSPCSCSDYTVAKKRVYDENGKVVRDENGDIVYENRYYCKGYCPGKHYDYSCSGHTEKVCYGEHQDITVTITCLGFDEIFYADSGAALSGSTVRGEAYEGSFTVTGYCSCKICCGEYSPEVTGRPSQTASGTTPKANHTIAVDPKVIPLGTHVWIDGREYVAEDTGGAIKGNRIDIYFDSHSKALQWGKRTKTVYKSVVVSDDENIKRSVIDYLALAENATGELFSTDAVLKAFGQSKEPAVEWKYDRVNYDDVDSFVQKLRKYDKNHEDEEFTNAELNTFEYVNMTMKELKKLCKDRGLNDSGSAYIIITERLIPYDKEHPDVLINSSTSDENGLYFEGWTQENRELAKHYYTIATSEDGEEIYTGLDLIGDISCGVSSSKEYDFSDIVYDDATGLTNKQKKVLSVIESNRVATVSGMCQSWVAHVYQSALGGAYTSKCCANHAGEAWGVSDDWSKIQVGATVYGYSSSIYGHVGIYIGNGMVAHNIGYLKIQSLESWVNTYNGQCWGWNGGNNLSGKSAYNCKQPGTFMKGKD